MRATDRIVVVLVSIVALVAVVVRAQSGPATIAAVDAVSGAATTTVGDVPNNAIRTTGSYDVALLRGLSQLNAALNAMKVHGTFGQAITSTAGALDVNIKSPQLDPCAGVKENAAISQTANARIVAGSAGKRIWICSTVIVGADAENVSVVEGTGTTCATTTAAVIGGATAAAGPNLAAGGGFASGNGAASVAMTGVAGDDVCLFQSGAGRVAGNLTYVQF